MEEVLHWEEWLRRGLPLGSAVKGKLSLCRIGGHSTLSLTGQSGRKAICALTLTDLRELIPRQAQEITFNVHAVSFWKERFVLELSIPRTARQGSGSRCLDSNTDEPAKSESYDILRACCMSTDAFGVTRSYVNLVLDRSTPAAPAALALPRHVCPPLLPSVDFPQRVQVRGVKVYQVLLPGFPAALPKVPVAVASDEAEVEWITTGGNSEFDLEGTVTKVSRSAISIQCNGVASHILLSHPSQHVPPGCRPGATIRVYGGRSFWAMGQEYWATDVYSTFVLTRLAPAEVCKSPAGWSGCCPVANSLVSHSGSDALLLRCLFASTICALSGVRSAAGPFQFNNRALQYLANDHG